MDATLQVLLGAAVALLGTVVTTILRYSVEERQRRTRRKERRHEGLRRYLIACLKMANLAWNPSRMESIAPGRFGPPLYEEWKRLWSSDLAELYSLPAAWAVGMYADDEVLLGLLHPVNELRLALGKWEIGVMSPSEAFDPPVTYQQMEEVVVQARKRLDELEDKP